MQLRVSRLDSDLPIPRYAHDGDAGLDLFAAEDATIAAGHRLLVRTGIAVAIPEGYAGFVQPRSGLALRHGLSFVNTPGLIDSHYRGEIMLIAINLDSSTPIEIRKCDKVAQLVIQRVERCEVIEVDGLDSTVRGEGGFGSTGL
ncbi:MAG TPA: dUTP diphosphatase [Coriobacteriia bacterium]|nr:dUTP diphosphatase [Coriobacteriia bacterium]